MQARKAMDTLPPDKISEDVWKLLFDGYDILKELEIPVKARLKSVMDRVSCAQRLVPAQALASSYKLEANSLF